MFMLRALSFLAVLPVVWANAALGSTASALSGRDVGYFEEYALGSPASGPAIVAVDEDDNVWVALAKSGKLGRFSNGVLKEFDMGADSRPVGIAIGSQANGQAGLVWIAASYDNKLIRFDVVTHEKREFKIDGDNSWPFNIAIGKDGGIWFTERASGRVGRLDVSTGRIQHYEPPTKGGGPAGLGVNPRTGSIWFTESYADRIGVLEPISGEIKEYKMGDKSTGLTTGPAGLWVDSEGGVWFAKLDGKLGHIAYGSESIELVEFPSEVRRPAGITGASNGDIWAAALDGNALVRYRPATREFTTFAIPTGEPDLSPSTPPAAKSSRPFGIAVDGQGNVWFSEQYTGKLGVLDAAPPTVKIASPAGVVRSAFPLLGINATDRVSGIAKVVVKIDDAAVDPVQGRLDLQAVLPGEHRLEVTAVGRSGLQAHAVSSFQYQPSAVALLEMLSRLRARGPDGEASKAKLLANARDVVKGDVRAKLQQMRIDIRNGEALFESLPKASLLATVDYLLNNASRTVEVQILDTEPYFSSHLVTIAAGDTVSWKYAPATDGHSVSYQLHRVEIVGKARSGMLRAGDTFSYRFEDPGEYTVRDERNEVAGAVIKVVTK